MNKKIMVLLSVFFGTIVLLLIYFGLINSVSKNNLTELQNRISSLDENRYELNEITPFEWETMYTFGSYMQKDAIEKILGFRSNLIKEAVSEGMQQIIFLKDNKIVCYIYGYSDKLGFYFKFDDNLEEYVKLDNNKNNFFEIIENNKVREISYED